MEGDSLKLNFEIALEKIDTLTQHNNELLNKVEELEIELKDIKSKSNGFITKKENLKFNNITNDADAAMKRYKQYLKKEFKNAKSKQSQGQPVWKGNS